MTGQDADSARALHLARRWYPSAREVTAVFDDGLRHRVFEIDGEVVLKVPRDATPPDELQREEFVLREIGRLSDLAVPRVLDFDAEMPCLCLTRVPGTSLLDQPWPWPERALREVGRALAELHSLPTAPFVASPLVETIDLDVYWGGGLGFLREERLVTSEQAFRLDRIFGDIRALLAGVDHVLLNGDVWPHHCFVDQAAGKLTGILDFADARIGPAAWEFASRWHGHLEEAEDVIVREYVACRGLSAHSFVEQVEAARLLKAVWEPKWARERGLGTRGWRFYLGEIERQVARGT